MLIPSSQPFMIGNNDNELGLAQVIPGALGPAVAPGQLDRANELAFTCPAGYSAAARSRLGVPTWRYRYMGIWENTALAPGMGAYHSSEIPLVFGATELKPNASSNTEEEDKLSGIMRHAWAEFAKDPQEGLKKLGWPAYNPSSKFSFVALIGLLTAGVASSLIRLGYQNMSKPDFAPALEYDKDCKSMGFTFLKDSNSTSSPALQAQDNSAAGGMPSYQRLWIAFSLVFASLLSTTIC